MGINANDAASKENWNKSNHGDKLKKMLMALHSWR